MVKNAKLRTFYNEVYKKGEHKHFTSFVTKGTTDEIKEVHRVIYHVICKTVERELAK